MHPVDANTEADRDAATPSEPTTDLASFFADGADDVDTDLLDNAVDIGARLAQARASVGISPRQLADQLGVRESTITKWESGQTSPRGHRVSKLAGMLGVSISWILMGRGVEPSAPVDDVDQIRAELSSIRGRLEDAVNELAVLDQRLSSMNEA